MDLELASGRRIGGSSEHKKEHLGAAHQPGGLSAAAGQFLKDGHHGRIGRDGRCFRSRQGFIPLLRLYSFTKALLAICPYLTTAATLFQNCCTRALSPTFSGGRNENPLRDRHPRPRRPSLGGRELTRLSGAEYALSSRANLAFPFLERKGFEWQGCFHHRF
jgi:hypothetical protein